MKKLKIWIHKLTFGFCKKICRIHSLDELKVIVSKTPKEKLKDTGFNIIDHILRASDKEVGGIMVPRVDMITVPEDMPLREVIEIYKKYGYSKLPIVSGRTDKVVGVLYIKELLKNLDKLDTETVSSLKSEAYFVPETQKVLDTLNFFQSKHLSIAMVVDEYGTVIGLVTLEDVLEEIVGEIWEEFDKEEQMYEKVADGVYHFNAKTPLDEASSILKIEFDVEDVNTIGGFIMSEMERFPQKGDEIVYKGYRFKVLDVDNQRIKKVEVSKIEEKQP